MSPHNHQARRHFSNQMFSPYFISGKYEEEHGEFEKKIEKIFKKIIGIFLKRKRG